MYTIGLGLEGEACLGALGMLQRDLGRVSTLQQDFLFMFPARTSFQGLITRSFVVTQLGSTVWRDSSEVQVRLNLCPSQSIKVDH